MESLGWSALDLFATDEEGTTNLQQGRYKLPLLKGALNFHYEEVYPRGLPVPKTKHPLLGIRLVHGRQRKAAEKAQVDPVQVRHMYHYPKNIDQGRRTPVARPKTTTPVDELERNKGGRKTKTQTERSEESKTGEEGKEDGDDGGDGNGDGDADNEGVENTDRATAEVDSAEIEKEQEVGLHVIGIVGTLDGAGEFVSTLQVHTELKFDGNSVKDDSGNTAWDTMPRSMDGADDDDENDDDGNDDDDEDYEFKWNECHLFPKGMTSKSKSEISIEVRDEGGKVHYIGTMKDLFKTNGDFSHNPGKMFELELTAGPDAERSDDTATLFIALYDKDNPPANAKGAQVPVEDAAAEEEKEDEDEVEEDVVPGLQKTKKKAQLSKTLVNKGDGVDIYIDGARLLPDNVTVSRVASTVMYGSGAQQKVRLVSFSFPSLINIASVQTTAHCLHFSFRMPMKQVLKAVHVQDFAGTKGKLGGVVDLECDARSPTFSFRVEISSQDAAFDPTASLVLRLDCLEKGTKKPCRVGYALINIFNEKDNMRQPKDSGLQDFVLNEGAFQIPLYQDLGPTPHNMENVKKSLRVPGSSVLIRIVAAKKDDSQNVLSMKDGDHDELFIEAPNYSDGAYDNTSLVLLDGEKAIYSKRVERDELSVYDAMSMVAVAADKVDEMENQQRIEWIGKTIGKKKPANVLDVSLTTSYQSDLGFKLRVDGGMGMNFGSGYFSAYLHVSQGASGEKSIRLRQYSYS